MKEKPLISVVVPVYNVGEYLAPSLDSLLAQDYPNLEILLVDDGSSDGSGALCDGYAARDSRVRVLHQENQGQAAARNHGVAAARGEYTAFIDSDDYVAPNYISYMAGLMEETGAQIGICTLSECEPGQEWHPVESREVQVMTASQALETMLYQRSFTTSPCCKLYPTRWLQETPFPTGRIYEDLGTIYKLLARAEKVVYGPSVLYCYIQTKKSTMRCSFSPRAFDHKTSADELYAFVEERYPQILPAAVSRRFSAYCQVIGRMAGVEGYQAERKALWDQICRDRWQVAKNPRTRVKNRIAALLTLLGCGTFGRIYARVCG